MKERTKIVLIIVFMFVLFTQVIAWRYVATLNDRNIGTFTGAWGMVRLAMPWNDYVVLTEEPLEVMVSQRGRQWDELTWLYENFFDDGFLCFGHMAQGYIDGIPAHAGMRAYTGRRSIITFSVGGFIP